MKICKEEIFGPVQSIIKFKDVKEVIERCNNTEYGLAAAVITKDISNVFSIANNVKAGTVWVNSYHDVFPYAEFGGYKQSGFGRGKKNFSFVFLYMYYRWWKRWSFRVDNSKNSCSESFLFFIVKFSLFQ